MSDDDPGHPFLVFLNTVEDDGKTRLTDSFATADDLLTRMIAAGLATPGTPVPGGRQMTALRDLREAAYATLSAIAARRRPGREDALFLETAIRSALQDAGFDFGPAGLRLGAGPLGGLHDQAVLSLFDFMRSDAPARLRECGRCTRLFLGQGRGRGRRWCAMTRCGNRTKAEAFRARHQPPTA